jgi:hypothetical protein
MQCYSPNGDMISDTTRKTYRNIGAYLRYTRLGNHVFILEYIGLDTEMWRFVRIGITTGTTQGYSYSRLDIPNYSSAAVSYDGWKGNANSAPALIWPGDVPAMPVVMNPQPETNGNIGNTKWMCPLCGSNTIERKGKFGKFYACSAWPKTKCPGTLNQDGKPSKKILAMIKKAPKSEKNKNTKDVEFTAVDMLDI